MEKELSIQEQKEKDLTEKIRRKEKEILQRSDKRSDEETEEIVRLSNEHLALVEERYKNASVSGYLGDFMKGIRESAQTPPTSTGFWDLDNQLGGGLYEGLYTIGAVTSLGKTTLVLQIADQIAQGGKDVLIFSLEMARTELMAKSISRHTLKYTEEHGLPTKYAKTNRGITDGARYKHYSEKESHVITEAVEEYGKYTDHLYIYEGIGNIGTKEIREAVETHITRKGEAPIVIVDYLQILAPPDFRMTDKQATDRNIVELKRISRDYKTPVIGISSYNRENYRKGSDSNGAVTLEAFKESGALEYTSDVAIGLQFAGAGSKDFDLTEAKKKDPRRVELVILKNRNGKSWGKVNFTYYPLFNTFKEGKPEDEAEPIPIV